MVGWMAETKVAKKAVLKVENSVAQLVEKKVGLKALRSVV